MLTKLCQKLYMEIFVEVSPVVAKDSKHSKCPSVEGRVNQLCYLRTIDTLHEIYLCKSPFSLSLFRAAPAQLTVTSDRRDQNPSYQWYELSLAFDRVETLPLFILL